MDSNDSPVLERTSKTSSSVVGLLIGDELGQIKRIDMSAKTTVIAINKQSLESIHPSKAVSSITCLDSHPNSSCVEYLIANKSNTLSLFNSISNQLVPIRIGVNNESYLMGAQPIDANNIVLCYANGSVIVKNIEKDLIESNANKKKAIKLLGLDFYGRPEPDPNENEGLKRKVSKSVQCSNGKDVLPPKSCRKPSPKPSKLVNSESSITACCTSVFSPNYNTSSTCLTCFKVCADMLAIAGKNVDLKVFDLNTKQSIFTAKPLSNDWLGLKQQNWVSGVDWVGGNSKNNCSPSWVATCSRSDSIVRIYDIRSKQRKPVLNIDLRDQTFNNDSNPPSFTSICSTSVPHTIAKPTQNVILGTTIGRMMALDLRFNTHSYRHLGVFKGFGGGAVRDIKYVPQSYNSFKIVSVSLDRFVRIHNFKTCSSSTRSLESKIYLKTRPTCVEPICSHFTYDSTFAHIDDDIEDSDIE